VGSLWLSALFFVVPCEDVEGVVSRGWTVVRTRWGRRLDSCTYMMGREGSREGIVCVVVVPGTVGMCHVSVHIQ
jgi:hypothetical protein